MSVTAGLAGCHPRVPVGATQTLDRPAAQPRDAGTPVDAARGEARCDTEALLARLRAQSVDRTRFARQTLYTWTTAEQFEELRHGAPLLTRETSPTHGVSLYEVALDARASRGDRVAEALRTPPFRKARFAWANPWATLLGWEGETYGDRLLRITLRDEAWIVRITQDGSPTVAVDLQGRPVELAEVLAHPERIGAVHYVHDTSGARGTFLSPQQLEHGTYREYVLPNEAMIAQWELGTDAVRSSIADSIDLMTAMQSWLGASCTQDVSARMFRSAWDDEGDADDVIRAWSRASAFNNDQYQPTVATTRAIVAALRNLPRIEAFTGAPASTAQGSRRRPVALEAWPAVSPAPPAPAPRRRGTFVGTYRK